MSKTTYTIRFELLPERSQRPEAVRLRGLLKVALRAFGLRCVEVRETKATENAKTATK